MKKKINLKNQRHQHILVKLTLMYYSSGDVQDVYEDDELCQMIEEEFGASGMKEVGEFLDREEVKEYYENWEYLKVLDMPGFNKK